MSSNDSDSFDLDAFLGIKKPPAPPVTSDVSSIKENVDLADNVTTTVMDDDNRSTDNINGLMPSTNGSTCEINGADTTNEVLVNVLSADSDYSSVQSTNVVPDHPESVNQLLIHLIWFQMILVLIPINQLLIPINQLLIPINQLLIPINQLMWYLI